MAVDYTKLSVERLLEMKKEAEENIAAYERTLLTWNSFLGRMGLKSALKREREKLEKIKDALGRK